MIPLDQNPSRRGRYGKDWHGMSEKGLERETEGISVGEREPVVADSSPKGGRLRSSWKKLWKGRKRKALALLLVVAIAGGVVIWRGRGQTASAATTYQEAAVERRSITNSLSSSGTLEPADSYTVNTLVSGEILSDTFEEGDQVAEGQLLYTLDSSSASNSQTQAKNSYTQAQTNYKQAVEAKYPTADMSGTVSEVYVKNGDTVSAGTELMRICTITGDSVDNSIENAKISMENARSSLENAQETLDDYSITAPISGTVVTKNAKAGDNIEGASGSTLCVIYDLSYLEMTMSIDELDISSVEVGQEVQITADAVEGQTYTGVVTEVSVAGTTSGGITTYPVTVRIDETDGLLPGMNVDAEIVLEEAADTLAIPSSAVTRGSGNTSLVLITQDSPSAESAVEQESPEGYVYVQVETGISDNSYVQILSGLQEGDTVAYVTRSTESGSMMMGGMPGAMGGDMPAGMPSGMGSAPGGGMPSGGGPGGGFPG